ncbi:MAG: molybdenum cofactor guanylyltransferase [Gammaproteobacteria bacterium]|nr:molybdenum cofactor guanylyltransferase [Gammaproteobacteria bacterium]MCP5137462.1 molybdenum cofactor guanylyltransferase [Gammaproteobacteria bacterium]
MNLSPAEITGVILTGGRGTRMGGEDKGLVVWRDRPLIAHVRERLRPQVGRVIINANRNAERYRAFGDRVVADPWPDYRGPLAGVLAALEAMVDDWLLCVPCDAPRLPLSLADRLSLGLGDEGKAGVADDGHPQPVFSLLHRDLAAPLREFLEADGRAVIHWLRSQHAHFVDCRDLAAGFANFNRPEDLL